MGEFIACQFVGAKKHLKGLFTTLVRPSFLITDIKKTLVCPSLQIWL